MSDYKPFCMMMMMIWCSCSLCSDNSCINEHACQSFALFLICQNAQCWALSNAITVFCTNLFPCRLTKLWFFSRRSCIRAMWRHRLYVTVSSACRGARARSTWKRARDKVPKEKPHTWNGISVTT